MNYSDQSVEVDDIENSLLSILPNAGIKNSISDLKESYSQALPYPHSVLDGAYNSNVLNRIIKDFPDRKTRQWQEWDTQNELRSTSRGNAGLSDFTNLFLSMHQSSEFIGLLEDITGIEGLLPDPMYAGAGLHEVFRGGRLDIHSDWTHHPVLPLKRYVNVLIYLNHDWQADWGGNLELWDRETMTCGASYPPLFNRMVIFPTTFDSLHGQPEVLNCPENRSRKLVSLYYWKPIDEKSKGEDRTSPIHWYPSQTDEIWESQVDAVVEALAEVANTESQFILVDDGKLMWDHRLAGFQTVPLMEKDGRYMGVPANDETAITELERLRKKGAQYLVFTWPSFWWLEYYKDLSSHLHTRYQCVKENESVLIFKL